jgi:hypothetical protein
MMRRILITASLSLAVLVCLSRTYTGATAQPPDIGQKLVGTWAVTVRFTVCSMACPCPPGVTPDTLIPALHTYSHDGTMEEVSGGTLYRGPALGLWEHVRDQQYSARYKFFIFNPATGALRLTEIVTSRIELQGPDAFEASATFDLFAADGVTPVQTSCPIEITGTRF